jgi:dihydrofolate reductase
VGWQEFARYWPQQPSDGDIADYMNNSQKYVVSNTLETVDEWQNSTLVKGDVMTELGKLKEQPGKNIGMSGSGMLVRSLLQERLLDELHLLVHPIVVGKGKRLFPDGTAQQGLQLADARTLSNGVLYLTYAPAP